MSVICKKANSALSFLRIENQVKCVLDVCSTNSKVCDLFLVPHLKQNIDKLKSVQRRAARFVMGNYHYTSSVTEMLNSLKWSSISFRVNTFKLYKGCTR